MTKVTSAMVIAACDAYRKWQNRLIYAEAMRRALQAALSASAACPESAELGLKTNQSLTPLEEELVEALKTFSVFTVEEDIGAIYFSVNGQRAWVSIGSNIAPLLLQLDAIQRSALSRAESRQPEPRPDSKALPVGRGER